MARPRSKSSSSASDKAARSYVADADLGSTRARILTAAERLFAEHGFGNVSMPAIAKASGITAGAIYKHFDSKVELFFEVVRRAVQSIPLPAAPTGAPDATSLPSLVAMYTTPSLKLLRQLAIEIHSASARHRNVRRLLEQSLEHNIEQVRSRVVAAQEAGKLDPEIDATLLGETILVFVMGLMHMESLLPHRIGDPAWHDFVQNRVAALIGAR